MNGPSDERVTEWTGGSLNELMIVLSAAALPARIRVFAPGPGDAPAGEVHLLAGGVNDAFAGEVRGDEAVAALQRVTGARFLIDTRLPDPETGSLAKPGPAEGNLAKRPLVEVMRYCEEYVLTCTLEVWRGEEQARISYRRGEMVGTEVGGSDAPDRLPEVMGWKEGFFEIALPLPVTPPVPALSKRSTASMAVAGGSTGTAPPSGERVRRPTDPLISVGTVKKGVPGQLAPAAARPTGVGGPRLPPGPPLPGLQARSTAPIRSQPAPATGPKSALSGPAPATPVAAAPIRRSGPLPSVPGRPTAQTPIAGRTAAGIATTRPASPPASTTQAKKTPPIGVPLPAPPGAAPGPPAASAAVADRAPQAPLASPMAKVPAAAAASPPAPLASPAAKPSVVQTPARSLATPPPKAAHPTPAQGSGVTPPPVSASSPASAPPVTAPAAPPTSAPGEAVQHKTPAPAKYPASQPVWAGPADKTVKATRPRPAEPPSTPLPSAIHGALNTTTNAAAAALRRTPGEMRRSLTPVRGTEELPAGVELSEDMQDPAAYVDTPPPESPAMAVSREQSTPTPSLASERMEAPTVRLSNVGMAPSGDLSVDFNEPRLRPSKRRARRGVRHWPLLVHVLLGIALGAAIVAAYSAYYGLPIP
jgi:hypothetical protein